MFDMSQRHPNLNLILAVGFSFFCFLWVAGVWAETSSTIESYSFAEQNSSTRNSDAVGAKPARIKVKGLYLTAYSAGSAKKMDEVIKLIGETELNAVVIDLKDYSGHILYDSGLPFVNKTGLKSAPIKNLKALVEKLKNHKIYAIARISVFQDPLLAEKKPEWAIKNKNGGLWRDKKGLAWVDPAKKEVWNYVISVAKEAVKNGFDEINFDYVRFPTDGNLSEMVYGAGVKRYEVIGSFLKYAADELKDAPAYVSVDLFGLTTEAIGENDMRIGQRFADAVKYFDYVMPMVYPSHYPAGYLGYKNPADHPYEVVLKAMQSGMKKAEGQKAKLRAWIQAFNLGAVYDGEKIRAEIRASDEAGANGWVLWNAANRYTTAGLEKE